MKNLKEDVILHFDLEDGTHKAIPFKSEEDALAYMDSDDFPIGEWVGDYTIEPVDSTSNGDEEDDFYDADDYDESFYIVLDDNYHKIQELIDEDNMPIYKAVNFSNKDDAVAYALKHPEVYYVQEMFGPDLCDCYEGDFVWERGQEAATLTESEESALTDAKNFQKREEQKRSRLRDSIDDGSLSKSQFQDFLRIDLDSDIPNEDLEFLVRDINEYFNGNFANIESIEYLDNKDWCPVLGLKEVEDKFQFRFEGVTKYSFRDGNVRYIGWGGQDAIDVTEYFLSHPESKGLVGYVLKDEAENVIKPNVTEDIEMLDDVQFLNVDDAITYAKRHPEVYKVDEVYGSNLEYSSSCPWCRLWDKPSITESKKKKIVKEAVVKWTNDIGEATANELNQQVKKTLGEYGYSFGGNQSERPVCAPKKYYLQDRDLEGHTTYLLSVKGEYYDEIIIQVCNSKVCGMANYTIRSPEGVLWMGQTPKEFVEDIRDMTSGYNEM